MEQIDISALITMLGILMTGTNIIVEVIKKVTWDKIPTNLLALMVSEVLTLASGAAYAQMNDFTIHWYTVVAAVVAGFIVALASMIGFDKVLSMLKGWKHE